MAKAGRGADQYMLRLPDGLRDRIKAYAERRGTSINSEIVRILEREFPEPLSIEEQLGEILVMLGHLAGPAEDETPESILGNFTNGLFSTLTGIESGQIGADKRTREIVADALARWREVEQENAHERYISTMDEEEAEQYERTGSTAKFVGPGFPDDQQ